MFDRYQSEQDDYAFTKTMVVVRLARAHKNEQLVSRSQAKRVLSRLNRFKHVVLDFSGIDFLGPAFADEIFRVYRNEHPGIEISHTNAVEDVDRMITRAIAHKE